VDSSILSMLGVSFLSSIFILFFTMVVERSLLCVTPSVISCIAERALSRVMTMISVKENLSARLKTVLKSLSTCESVFFVAILSIMRLDMTSTLLEKAVNDWNIFFILALVDSQIHLVIRINDSSMSLAMMRTSMGNITWMFSPISVCIIFTNCTIDWIKVNALVMRWMSVITFGLSLKIYVKEYYH